MNDQDWRDWCHIPSRFERVLFWIAVAFMCVCTLIVIFGGVGYLSGFF